jgi:hypothetical protein
VNIPDLPPAQYLQVDQFPAKIYLPDGEMDRVRVVVTDAHVNVLKLERNGDLSLAYSQPISGVERDTTIGPRGFRVFLKDGTAIEAQKSLNCGCGMGRVRSAKLYHPVLPLQAIPHD